MHVVWPRPRVRRRAEPEHDVRADQSGEEHDFRRQKQPQTTLAIRNRQRRLVGQFDGRVAVIGGLAFVRIHVIV